MICPFVTEVFSIALMWLVLKIKEWYYSYIFNIAEFNYDIRF